MVNMQIKRSGDIFLFFFLMDRLTRGSGSGRGGRRAGNLGRKPNPWDCIHPVTSRTYLIVQEMCYLEIPFIAHTEVKLRQL